MKTPHIIMIISVTIFILLLLTFAIVEGYRGQYIEKTGVSFQGAMDEHKGDCSKYEKFIKEPINTDYYTFPRFKNPRESCYTQCMEGVWNLDHTSGSVGCCKNACNTIADTIY
jgi:hypothetical protein